jgi:hypothetical protein
LALCIDIILQISKTFYSLLFTSLILTYGALSRSLGARGLC